MYAVRWLDSATFLVAVVQAVVPVAGIVIVATTLLAAVSRRRRTALVGAIASVVVLVGAAPFVIPSGRAEPGPDDVVVMSSNLQYGRADAVALTERVRALDVDILVLLEVTPSAVDLLRAAGLEATPPFPGEVNLSQPVARVDLPGTSSAPAGRPMLIRAVHPMPPTDPNLGFWRSALDGLATWAHSQPDGIPLVLAGDFNASADHPGYRQVADGLVDAALESVPTGFEIPAAVRPDRPHPGSGTNGHRRRLGGHRRH